MVSFRSKFGVFLLLTLSAALNVTLDPTTARAEYSGPTARALTACYQEILEKEHGRAKFNAAFSNFQPEKLYELFIDVFRLRHPKPNEAHLFPDKVHLLFDIDEPGYHRSMMEAFEFLSFSIGEKVTLDYLIRLHDLAVGHVMSNERGRPLKKGLGGGAWGYTVPGNRINSAASRELFLSRVLFRPDWVLSDLAGKDFSNSGLSSFLKRAEGNGIAAVINDIRSNFLTELEGTIPAQGQSKARFTSLTHNKAKVEALVAPLLSYYYDSIESAISRVDRISAVAELVRALEVGHLFPDGNQRTFVFLLLNKLLIENNIPPAILYDPGIFDGMHTLDAIVSKIRSGIAYFLSKGELDPETFMRGACPGIDPSAPKWESFLRNEKTDYVPYFSLGMASLDIATLKSNLELHIEESILVGQVGKQGDGATRLDRLPLMDALFVGDESFMSRLLDAHADPLYNPFSTLGRGRSPLNLAIQLDQIWAAQMMIDSLKNRVFFKQDLLMEVITSEALKDRDDLMERLLELVYCGSRRKLYFILLPWANRSHAEQRQDLLDSMGISTSRAKKQRGN